MNNNECWRKNKARMEEETQRNNYSGFYVIPNGICDIPWSGTSSGITTSMQNMRQLLGTDKPCSFVYPCDWHTKTGIPSCHTYGYNIRVHTILWHSNLIISKSEAVWKLNCFPNGRHINYIMHISFDLLHIAFYRSTQFLSFVFYICMHFQKDFFTFTCCSPVRERERARFENFSKAIKPF